MSSPKRARSRSSSRGPGIRPKPIAASISSSPARDELTKNQKISSIKSAINAEEVDVKTLRQLAISRGGLLTDELRRKAWPKLLSVDISNIPQKPDIDILHGHRDYQQVVLDVNRSLKRFPPGMEETKRLNLQDQLVDVIMRVLVANDELHYYQGYHDICVTFLLVVGEDITFALMDKLSQDHLRDFMDKDMDRTKHMLNFLYPLIGKANPELKLFMEKSEVGTIFALSWLITWYGHVLGDFKNIVRLYDYFIACHQLMPIYLCASVVLYRQKDILASDCDMPTIHSLLSKIPSDLPWEHLASHAGDLYCQFPPQDLEREAEAQHQKILEQQKQQRIESERQREEFLKRKAAHARSLNGSQMQTRYYVFAALGALSGIAVIALSYGWRSFHGESGSL